MPQSMKKIIFISFLSLILVLNVFVILNLTPHTVKAVTCSPRCSSPKVCDGSYCESGQCKTSSSGSCVVEPTCTTDSNCCVADCTNKECGDDGCSGSCGACDTDDRETCTSGKCECSVTCPANYECGDYYCAGSCGTCGSLEYCSQHQCEECDVTCTGNPPNNCYTCNHCTGSWENGCSSSQVCVNSTCQDPGCNPSCDSSRCETCNNGTCGSSCDSSKCEECKNGSCSSKCSASQTCDNGTCKNTDPCKNGETTIQCGKGTDGTTDCGTCSGYYTCVDGICVIGCERCGDIKCGECDTKGLQCNCTETLGTSRYEKCEMLSSSNCDCSFKNVHDHNCYHLQDNKCVPIDPLPSDCTACDSTYFSSSSYGKRGQLPDLTCGCTANLNMCPDKTDTYYCVDGECDTASECPGDTYKPHNICQSGQCKSSNTCGTNECTYDYECSDFKVNITNTPDCNNKQIKVTGTISGGATPYQKFEWYQRLKGETTWTLKSIQTTGLTTSPSYIYNIELDKDYEFYLRVYDKNNIEAASNIVSAKCSSSTKPPCSATATANPNPIPEGQNQTTISATSLSHTSFSKCKVDTYTLSHTFTQTDSSHTYTVSCTGDAGYNNCSSEITVTKGGAPSATITLSADKTNVAVNEDVTFTAQGSGDLKESDGLDWNIGDTTPCSHHDNLGGDCGKFKGCHKMGGGMPFNSNSHLFISNLVKPLIAQQVSAVNLTSTLTYSWSQQGNYNVKVQGKDLAGNPVTSNTVMITVSIVPPPTCSVSLTASPKIVLLGRSLTLTWSMNDACSGCKALCSYSDDTNAYPQCGPEWKGLISSTSGSKSVTPQAKGTYTYTISCNGGTAEATVTVQVILAPWWREIIPNLLPFLRGMIR